MIEGISAFSSVFLQGLAQSANSDGQRNNSGNRGSSSAPVLTNTDATGLKLSAEQRRAIQERQQNDRNGNGQMQEAPRSPVTRGIHGYARAAASAETESGAVSRQQARGMAFSSARSFSQGRYSGLSESAPPQIDMERAAAAYRRMGGETGLALFGTGISLRV